MSEMKTKIEAIANVTVIVVALALGYVMLNRYVASSHVPHSVAAGDRLAKLPGLDWNQHRRTLVLVLNTGCHFCQDSIPFYQKLAQAQRPGRDVPEIVDVFPNEAEMVRQSTAHEGLTIQSIAALSIVAIALVASPPGRAAQVQEQASGSCDQAINPCCCDKSGQTQLDKKDPNYDACAAVCVWY